VHSILSRLLLLLFFITSWQSLSAQYSNIGTTFKTIKQKSYFRIYYDNDYFTATDYYYTQGLVLNYVHPGLRKNPVNKILPKMGAGYNVYGISMFLFGYTPTNISSDSILYGDRPYAAGNTIKVYRTTTDSVKQTKFTSAISLGVIGPIGLGNEIQSGIHRLIKDRLPMGWKYQVHNDIILNYQLNYEMQLTSRPGRFLLNGVSEIRLGTLNDKLGTGINLMVGNLDDPYKQERSKKLSYYLYVQSNLFFIGYDASLQGGLFNRNSPYTIADGDIKRIVFQADAGISVNFKGLYLSYYQSYLTAEFDTGKYHRWGGVSIGFSL